MNKKGFTLVEIIVTITLIALIGIVIGVSLTKTIKIQEDNEYESFLEKVKSSIFMYSYNKVEIINLTFDSFFKAKKLKASVYTSLRAFYFYKNMRTYFIFLSFWKNFWNFCKLIFHYQCLSLRIHVNHLLNYFWYIMAGNLFLFALT